MKQSPIQIVLLGGGYVSIWAYRSLVKRLRPQLANGHVVITVICPVEHHVFHGWTAECLTGVMQPQNQQSPLSEVMPKAHVVVGKAEAIDTVAKQVSVVMNDDSRQQIPYHHLLVGIGAYDSNSVTGIQEHGYQVKSRQAFQRTKAAVQDLVRLAASENSVMAARSLSFTIIGGGFTGVELAANLAEYLELVKKDYPTLADSKPKISLINRSARVLPVLQSNFQQLVRYAEKTLDRYGIDVLNNVQATRITDEGVFLSDKSFISSRLVLSTLGQRRSILKGTEHIPRDEMQRLYTNENQQIVGQTTMWGGGDVCHVKHCQTGEPCPANALWAIKQGDYVGRNIARAIKGQKLKPFTYKGLGQSASLGIGKGITELYGVQFTGWIAWLMRWFFFTYFMPSRKVMLKAVGDWFFLLIRQKRKGLWIDEKMAESNILRFEGATLTAVSSRQ